MAQRKKVTMANFSWNLCRNKIARHVARKFVQRKSPIVSSGKVERTKDVCWKPKQSCAEKDRVNVGGILSLKLCQYRARTGLSSVDYVRGGRHIE